MKRFIKWQDDITPKKEKEVKEEGINPTDIDSAGKDQDLANTGVPFSGDAINKVASIDKERDELERDYQVKLWGMMNKKQPSDDPCDIDPTKGPHGETPGGILDKTLRDYLMSKIKSADEQAKKLDREREDVVVKTTSTYFIDDKKGIFTPRRDAKSTNGNADKSTNIIDKE